ncbi:MAG: energy-coupling factor transporter transmembrane protein EcfT [Sphaerochaetaceae bacterium]|nr:energy-coupling factor transporter transmembrane protein EcfT [Sphaerochaetaceae bacterium]
MTSKTVLTYIPKKSFVHNLTGTTKLVFFLLFTFSSMVTYDTRVLCILLLVSIVAFKASKIKIKEVRFMINFMAIFLFLNISLVFIFDPMQGTNVYGSDTFLCKLWGTKHLNIEELFYLFNYSLKIIVSIPLALLFISTTDPSEFAASLNGIGVSYKISYSVALALRYVPDIQRDYINISQAQQARGVELGKKVPLWTRLKNSISILLPLILSSISRIDVVSNAMELRGFGKNKKRTWYRKRPFVTKDYLIIVFGVLLLGGTLFLTFYNGNRFYYPF